MISTFRYAKLFLLFLPDFSIRLPLHLPLRSTNRVLLRKRDIVNARPFLTAEWRDLLMLNYPVQPALLRDRVPHGCELDEWNGTTFVSLVGFRFLHTRVLRLPIPFHRHFDEVNLRFYVRRKEDGEWRRGVVFIKEIVPRRAIAWVARGLYGENYVALPMRHHKATDQAGTTQLRYAWQRAGQWESIRAEFSGDARAFDDDSEERFISEHYWGYAKRGAARTTAYRVDHPRWALWQASAARFEGDGAALYGDCFAELLSATPSSAFIADGSAVVVRAGYELPR